jgi:T5SS/PEP-CTERM-associated repeat protein
MKRLDLKHLLPADTHPRSTVQKKSNPVLKHILIAMSAIVAVGFFLAPFTHAALTYSGDVSPADPSTWTSSTRAYVGKTASGSLTVDDGSGVVSAWGYLGHEAGSTGTVIVDGAGSTWTGSYYLYVGHSGTGSLSITNGGTVTNLYGFVGYGSGGSGTVYVDGAGSTWTNSKKLEVGSSGTGSLSITNGGEVGGINGIIGSKSGSSGTVIVDGAGSTWTNSGALSVGSSGTGMLSISDGGSVSASAVSINNLSTLTTDVGKGSTLTVGSGTGTITNENTIRLVAGAGAASGTYTPMQYASMGGSGTVQALGGVWNETAHTVTVSGAATAGGIGGATAAFNLATAQRVLITDSATGYSAGAAFQAGTADVTFTATAIGPTALAALQSLLASGDTVLSAWGFSVTGTTVSDTNPAYLSLYAGADQSLSTLSLWYYDGSTWSAYDAYDLAYDGTYASFTVTDFSGYAVSGAPVPIPAAVWMLGPALAGLVGFRRRFFRR